MKGNLNNLKILAERSHLDLVNNNSILTNHRFEKIEAYFRDIETELIRKIIEFEHGLIFGSIAWLTSYKILDALSKCKFVQIVVQKEDFLRPDLGSSKNPSHMKRQLRKKYDNLTFDGNRYDCREPICGLSILGDPSVDPVRCLGNYNSDKKSAFPRAHNKFLVFCKFIKKPSEETRRNKEVIYNPVGVWTGSFNLTNNASMSLENVLYLENNNGDDPIINAFLNEHHQIFALSEKLDWTSNWVAPQFRIGT